MALHRRQVAQAGPQQEVGLQPTAEEFARMQREVEHLGAEQLDKKALKKWKERQLQALGAKVPKGQRTGATIGGPPRHGRRGDAAWCNAAPAAGFGC